MTKSTDSQGPQPHVRTWQGFRSCGDRLSPAFNDSLAARQAAKASGLGVAAGGGAGNGVHGVQAIAQAVTAYLLAQPERVQASFDTAVNTQRVHLNGAVDVASVVADGDAVAIPAVPFTGVVFHNGQHFLINGQRVYPLDALAFHGVISPLDIGWFSGIEAAVSAVLRHAGEHADLQATLQQMPESLGASAAAATSALTPENIAKAVADELDRRERTQRRTTLSDGQ